MFSLKKILVMAQDKINKKGYNPAQIIDQDACIGCAICGKICPDGAIDVYR